MADISITATAVVAGSDAVTAQGTAGATITAGQAVYIDANGVLQLADCDAGTAGNIARSPVGIALNGGATGQPIVYMKAGDLTLNAALTKGARYYLSATAGGIAPEADMTGSGKDVVLLGIARSTTVLAVRMLNLGITL
ncbi:hypothetical protein RHODGE_RHODGE_01032 [Rhodoplanes serenus]|uniref:DUF2190 domain-containing protein n=1 Tax=Rhodoplanes serenus TaxID=200615 RepID=A0A447CRV4_9BRAD|nr:hypothetical protein [Rhodoplanes serenus]VCU06575.1 hypothetical protein RHODPL_RHODPL_00023 [Rhodoplanes serenus]VCU07882.1 hypothetical protein RHODGE_RHODGE_01032 [Rhodoplanes serenus]